MAGRKEFELLFKLQATLGSKFNSSMNGAMRTTKQLNGELSKINALSGKIDGFTKQSAAIATNKDKLAKLVKEHELLQQEMKQSEKPTEALRKQMDRNDRQIEQTTASIGRQENKLEELGRELKDAGINTDDLTGENEKLARSYDTVQKSQNKLASIAQAQQKNAAAISQTTSKLLGTIGIMGAIGAAIYAGPVKGSIAFKKEMDSVATLLDGEIEPRIATLSSDILRLSTQTGLGTGNLTDGLYQVISAFGDSAEAAQQLETAAKAAKAGNATTTDSINLLSAVTKGYGDTSAAAQQKAADLAFQTVKLGQTTFPELAASLGKVIPLAATLKVEQEELFGAMATLTGVTGNTAEVTTQLRGVLQGFLQPTASMTKTMNQLGYANGQVMLDSLGLQGALTTLKKSVNNDEIAFSQLFGSIEAKSAVLALTGKQAENLTQKTLEMYNAAGATEKAFEIMNNTPDAKLERTKIAIANLGIVLGDTFLPYVTTAAEKLTELVMTFSEWAQDNPKTLKTIVKVVGGLAALKVAGLVTKLSFLKMKGAILGGRSALAQFNAGMGGTPLAAEKVKNAFYGIGVAMKMLKNNAAITGIFSKIGGIALKLLPVVGVIALIAGAIYMVVTHLEEVRGFIQKVFGDDALKIFDKFVNTITSIGKAIKAVFSGDVGGARKIIEETFGASGAAAFDAIAKAISEVKVVFGEIMAQFSKLAASIMPILIELYSTFMSLQMQLVSSILPILKQLLEAIFPILEQVATTVLPVIAALFAAIVPILLKIVSTVLPVVVQLLNLILPIITKIISTVLPILTKLLEFLIPIIQIVADLFGNKLAVVIEMISGVIGGLTRTLGGLIEFITGVFTGNWSQAWEGIKNIFGGIWDSISSIFKGVINGVISGINTLLKGINKLKIPDWVPLIGGKGINIPLIPTFAKGTNYTPDTFIAGEAGAELVTNSKGRKVFTAAQTGQIFNNINRAGETTPFATLIPVLQAALTMITAGVAGGVTARTLSGGYSQASSIIIHSAPIFHVGSTDAAEDIEALLRKHDEDLMNEIEQRQNQRNKDERRRKYD